MKKTYEAQRNFKMAVIIADANTADSIVDVVVRRSKKWNTHLADVQESLLKVADRAEGGWKMARQRPNRTRTIVTIKRLWKLKVKRR